MANYQVNSERTAQSSATLNADFQTLMDILNKVRGEVDGLIAEGYATPSAEQQFKPFFDQFATGYTNVAQGLDGISKYVKAVGDAFDQTDQSLGQSLAG